VLTTALIFLPVAGALLIWLLPLDRLWAGSIALLVALAEVGLWINALVRFHFGATGLQESQRHGWFSDLGVSYHVGMYAGAGQIWHAPAPGQRVKKQKIWTTAYYVGRL